MFKNATVEAKNRLFYLLLMSMLLSALAIAAFMSTESTAYSAVIDTNVSDISSISNIATSSAVSEQIPANKEAVFIIKQEKEQKEEEERIAREQAVVEIETSYAEPTYHGNGSGLTKSGGVNYHNGWKETYYSSNVLYHHRTSEWTPDENGVYRDSEGYVIVASSSDPQGAVVDTSFGPGKVYDTGCAEGTHDIYTNW